MAQYEKMDSKLTEDIFDTSIHFDGIDYDDMTDKSFSYYDDIDDNEMMDKSFSYHDDIDDENIDVKRKINSKEVNRKEAKQISFRVSDQEYLKLKESAEILNLSVPMFVKKKAQGSRLITPKLDLNTRKKIAYDLSAIGNNINQISKWFNSNQDKAMYLSANKYNDLENQFKELKEELHMIWQQLN